MTEQSDEVIRLRKKLEKIKAKQPNVRFKKLHNLLESFGCRDNSDGSHYVYTHDYLQFPFTVVKSHGGDKRVDINDLEKAIERMEMILEQMELNLKKGVGHE